MSSVAFHSQDSETVLVDTGERDYAGWLCTHLFWSMLDISPFGVNRPDGMYRRIMSMIPSSHYIHETNARRSDPAGQIESLRTALGGFGPTLHWNHKPISTFSLQTNTALSVGNDAVKFLARMHGCCEIHGYVLGKNRWWLSDIIEQGAADGGMLRKPYQTQHNDWPALVAKLRLSSQTPVVMSYSVTESFPNASFGMSNEKPPGNYTDWTDEQHEKWEDLSNEFYEWPAHRQWETAFVELERRNVEEKWEVELKPETWSSFRFTHELSAFDLVAQDFAKRLDRKFPPPDEPSP